MTEEQRGIYLDYAASTPVSLGVRKAMEPYWSESFGNPRALHQFGKDVRAVVESARATVARFVDVAADEIYFTNGGADGNAKAIIGCINALQDDGLSIADMHLITTPIEHASVLSCIETLARRGASISYAPVNRHGLVDIDALQKMIRPATVLISVMLVNNEMGAVQSVERIAGVVENAKQSGIAFISKFGRPVIHSDASQAPVARDVRARDLHVDMLTIDGQKIYGPKGVGGLFVGNGVPYAGLCGTKYKHDRDGGGTPNVPLIAGFAAACEETMARRDGDSKRFAALRRYTIERIAERFAEARCYGEPTRVSPHILMVSLPGIEAEYVVTQLGEEKIFVSAKSACLSGGGEGSYVVEAIDHERANASLRVSFGRSTEEADIDSFIAALSDTVA